MWDCVSVWLFSVVRVLLSKILILHNILALGCIYFLWCLWQGVVTSSTLLEPPATGIKIFDQQKYILIAWFNLKIGLVDNLTYFHKFSFRLLASSIKAFLSILIAWFSAKLALDCLIWYWSRSQMVLQVYW